MFSYNFISEVVCWLYRLQILVTPLFFSRQFLTYNGKPYGILVLSNKITTNNLMNHNCLYVSYNLPTFSDVHKPKNRTFLLFAFSYFSRVPTSSVTIILLIRVSRQFKRSDQLMDDDYFHQIDNNWRDNICWYICLLLDNVNWNKSFELL